MGSSVCRIRVCVKDAVCFKHFSSHECAHLWHHNCKGCTVYCRFTAIEKYLHELHSLFNCFSMKPIKSGYCSAINDMLFPESYSGLSSAYCCIFTTFYKESLYFTRSRGMPKQNYLTCILISFIATKPCCEDKFGEGQTAVV